jgi:SAM-dependent methyltransferase
MASSPTAAAALRPQVYQLLAAYLQFSATPAQQAEVAAAASADDSPAAVAFLTLLQEYLQRFEAAHGLHVQSLAQLYFNPAAFDAFCVEGGNVLLYERLSRMLGGALAAVVAAGDAVAARSLFDIGCGSGRALLPVLAAYQQAAPLQVTALEPSPAMLEHLQQTVAATPAWPARVTVTPVAATLQQWMSTTTTTPAATPADFDIAWATFSLSSQPREERARLLPWIHDHVRLFVLAEFDCSIPQIDTEDVSALLAPSRFNGIVDRYIRGACEHQDPATRALILDGFLLPAFIGNFRAAPRFTFEQSQTAWVAACRAAGFAHVAAVPCAPFWWSDCALILASDDPALLAAVLAALPATP